MAELIIGILALLYGLYNIYLRVSKNAKAWGKLDRMKEVYGEKAGSAIHIISYTVVPIAIGIIGLAAYCLGIKVF
ncbi:MAG: hypothetical protein J6C35_06260 [Bacteroidales bacterium]|nr:hypothetical protein [Bacteroidales bacterium]